MNQASTQISPYRMSFTVAGLCIQESAHLAQRYLVLHDWTRVREEAFADNLLQARTQSTLRRILRELITRLQTLGLAELDWLTQAPPQEQAQLLWLAVCRCYTFVAEFAIDVLRERYLSLKHDLPLVEFDTFFNRKAQWHPELDAISPSTHNKLRQLLFRLLREAGLVTTGHTIQNVQLSPQLMHLLEQDKPEDALFFPTFEPQHRA